MLSITFTAKVQIVDYPELVREAFGTSQDLTCSATGDPPPMITWMKDGMMVRTFIIIVTTTTGRLVVKSMGKY